MPFRSKKQMKWMFANKPKMAHKWMEKYGEPTTDTKIDIKDKKKLKNPQHPALKKKK